MYKNCLIALEVREAVESLFPRVFSAGRGEYVAAVLCRMQFRKSNRERVGVEKFEQ